MEENSKIGKKTADYVKKSQNHKEKCEEQLLFPKEELDSLIEWHPVAREEKEQEVLQKPDFYNRILLLRRKNEGLG
jgi:hypothetical protein